MLFVNVDMSPQIFVGFVGVVKALDADLFSLLFLPETSMQARKKTLALFRKIPKRELALEPPTTYLGESHAAMATGYQFSESAQFAVEREFEFLSSVLDSIAFYKDDDRKWFACVIFHEHCGLMRDHSAAPLLARMGIPFADDLPNWW